MKNYTFIIAFITLFFGIPATHAEEYNQNLINATHAISEGNYAEALKFFKAGAIEGDKYCCGSLACMYANGIGGEVKISEARRWAMRGYKLGNSFSAAMMGLTYLLEYGMDNPDALEMALPYYEFAYNAEDREFDNAQLYTNMGFMVAMTYIQNGNRKEGMAWIERVINDFPTYSPALGKAAYCYWGIENYTNAVKYATMADKENDPDGTFVLGWCMAYGEGIEKNEEAGFKKIRKAANIGVTDYAMVALGECYYNGIGTPVNKSLAKEWFQKAADAGDEEAKEKLNELF